MLRRNSGFTIRYFLIFLLAILIFSGILAVYSRPSQMDAQEAARINAKNLRDFEAAVEAGFYRNDGSVFMDPADGSLNIDGILAPSSVKCGNIQKDEPIVCSYDAIRKTFYVSYDSATADDFEAVASGEQDPYALGLGDSVPSQPELRASALEEFITRKPLEAWYKNTWYIADEQLLDGYIVSGAFSLGGDSAIGIFEANGQTNTDGYSDKQQKCYIYKDASFGDKSDILILPYTLDGRSYTFLWYFPSWEDGQVQDVSVTYSVDGEELPVIHADTVKNNLLILEAPGEPYHVSVSFRDVDGISLTAEQDSEYHNKPDASAPPAP